MKKVIFTLGIFAATSFTALAASDFNFSDQGSFASWYASSVNKMQYHQIIKGYEDGSFKPNNNVTRAELSVMLDRFAENVVKRPLQEEPYLCTTIAITGLTINLYDIAGNPVSGATITTDNSSGTIGGNNGQYSGLVEGGGYYEVTIKHPDYTTHTETIKLEQTDCHVIPQARTIYLVPKAEELPVPTN